MRQPGKIVFGSGDADFDIGSNNTLHATTLMFFINPTFRTAQIGVSAVICPNVTSANFTVQRSDNDGFTWHRVGDPIVGQDGITAGSAFNNIQGPIVADPVTHNVYDIFASGQTGFLKGRTFTPNHVFVSRSTDAGRHWTASLVFQLPPPAKFDNVFPALAVDSTNGNLYADRRTCRHGGRRLLCDDCFQQE